MSYERTAGLGLTDEERQFLLTPEQIAKIGITKGTGTAALAPGSVSVDGHQLWSFGWGGPLLISAAIVGVGGLGYFFMKGKRGK